MKTYVVIYDDDVNVFNIIRGAENRNARHWLKFTGGKHVRIYTNSGKFVTYGINWGNGQKTVSTNKYLHDDIPDVKKTIFK